MTTQQIKSIPTVMQAVNYDRYGDESVLQLSQVAVPQPRSEEVLIKVVYAGVNPVDWKIREGLLQGRLENRLPIIPGWDVSGIVAAVGDKVRHLEVGDEVLAYCRKPFIQEGSYCEYVRFFAHHTVKKPPSLTFAQAAALPLAALTAWQALFDVLHLQEGETVYISAGSGGVGGYALQFAKFAGATVLTSASKDNHDYVTELGADSVYDYREGSLVENIRRDYPAGVDAVLEVLHGSAIGDSLRLLKPGGYIATLSEPVDMKAAAQAEAYSALVFVRPCGEQLQSIVDLLEQGALQVPQIQEFPLSEAAEAQRLQRQGHVRGKLVLRVS